MLKIAVYYSFYVPYLEDLFLRISQLGVKVDYFVGGPGANREHWTIRNDLNFKNKNYSRIVLSTRIKFDTKYAGVKYFDPHIVSKILKEKYDFFIIEFSEPLTILLSFFLKSSGSKIISWNGMCISSSKIIRKLTEVLVRLSANLSDYFIARTVYAKQYLLEKGADPKKIKVIPHGIDTKKFNVEKNEKLKEELKLQNQKVILYLGMLVYWKGVDYLIRAFKLIKAKRNDVHLLIIGRGPLENSLKQLVQQEKLEHSVTFLGTVPSSIINKYYSICDVHVAPSILTKDMIEIFGMVYLEAMASGKPSIAFDIPANVQKIISDGETGFLVPEKNVEKLAERICDLLYDDKKRLRMGKTARRKVETTFSLEAIGKEWVRTLKQIC
jgi:rhamnosyl/mannosyltransferase